MKNIQKVGREKSKKIKSQKKQKRNRSQRELNSLFYDTNFDKPR